MSQPIAPFSGTRFEYENEFEHLYYLPAKLFRPLEEPNPTYLIGSRGSGKTTLLKALNWKERITNRSLRAQFGSSPFAAKYIGIYIRCPHIQLGCFDRWLRGQDEEIAAEILSFELDLAWLKPLFEGVAELVRKQIIPNSAAEEAEFVEILANQPKLAKCLRALDLAPPKTLPDIADAFEATRSKLETAAKMKAPIAKVAEFFPLDQVGTFGRTVCALLSGFCDLHEAEGSHWYFKICLDESECLNRFALKVVNTAVRLSEWPVFFVVSFVRLPEDVTSTLFEKLTHQRADKRIVSLDSMRDDEFREFAQGVAHVRIQRASPDYQSEFQLKEILGTININRLLTTLLEESVRPLSKEIIALAKDLKQTDFYQDAIYKAPLDPDEEGQIEGGEYLPIYQAYLIGRLGLELLTPEHPKWIRRRQESREIRKKMVAAYLSICAEIGSDVRYASADIVFQLSDGCMRDFLFQLHELFIEVGRSIERFVRSEISWKAQDAALKRASKAKFESFPTRLTKAPSESGKVIEGLARLTALIQSRSTFGQHLASSERGKYEVDLVDSPKERNAPQYELLVEAAEAGFLKILISEPAKFIFRIHTSLAPYFDCSYRGAYYSTKITFFEVKKLQDARTTAALKDAVESIALRIDTGETSDQFKLKGLD